MLFLVNLSKKNHKKITKTDIKNRLRHSVDNGSIYILWWFLTHLDTICIYKSVPQIPKKSNMAAVSIATAHGMTIIFTFLKTASQYLSLCKIWSKSVHKCRFLSRTQDVTLNTRVLFLFSFSAGRRRNRRRRFSSRLSSVR